MLLSSKSLNSTGGMNTIQPKDIPSTDWLDFIDDGGGERYHWSKIPHSSSTGLRFVDCEGHCIQYDSHYFHIHKGIQWALVLCMETSATPLIYSGFPVTCSHLLVSHKVQTELRRKVKLYWPHLFSLVLDKVDLIFLISHSFDYSVLRILNASCIHN